MGQGRMRRSQGNHWCFGLDLFSPPLRHRVLLDFSIEEHTVDHVVVRWNSVDLAIRERPEQIFESPFIFFCE